MPEDMPEDMPDKMPDRMPEDMSEYMPEDMPDRMPEDMSNIMPEDMPERMPEDLPVRKCINVMGGITRSKVIYFFALCIASICIDLRYFVEAEVFFMHVLFASFLTHTIFKSIKWPCLSKSRVFLEI